MGRNVFLNMGLLLIILDDLPEALAGHTLTVYVDKQGRLIGQSDHLRAHQRHIVAEGLDRLGIHGDQSLLIPGAAADNPGGQVDVCNVQVYKLRYTDACGIQQLQHGLVPVALCVHTLRLFQQQIDLLAGEDLGQLVLTLVRNQLCCRVFLRDLPDGQIGVQTFQGSDGPRYCGYGLSLALQPVYVF